MAKPAESKAKGLSKTVAIDIGSKNIKIVRGTYGKNGVVNITDVIVEPTPEGCMENGYIKSQTDLNLFLRALIGKNDMAKCDAYAAVRSSDVVAREISVPAVKGLKIKKLIQNEIVTVFGNTADYYTDYVVTGTETVDYKTMHKIMAYAVPKEIVANYSDVLQSSDVKPTVLDVHRNIISKLIDSKVSINQESLAGKVVLLVDMGASYMDIDLVIDGVDVYKRTVSIADDVKASEDTEQGASEAGSLDDQIDAMYNSDGNNYEYENYEGYEGYDYNSDDYMYGSASRSQISPVFTRANEEIYKIMQFAMQKYGNKPVSNVYLYGGNSRIQGLDQYLSTALEVTVDRVCSISNVEISSDVNLADVLIAAGSLIRK
jgi:type IV pilus assembly protein PilM